MRILYIVTAFPRTTDDVITPWLSETIERLREDGIEVEVLAPSYRGLGEQVFRGTRVHRFRYAPAAIETLTHDQTTPDRIRDRPLFLALVPGYLAAGTLAAVRLARSGRFDVVHAFWPMPHGIFGLAARRFANVPLVSTFFGAELTWTRRQLPFLTPLVRSIAQRSDAVTVISSHTAAEVKRLAPDADVRTIPFGAAVTPDSAPAPNDPVRAVGGPFSILFIGRLVERKGVAVLLRALASLPAPTRLIVVGDGPERPALEAATTSLGLGDRVEFTGFVHQQELRRRIGESDVLVLPAIEDAKGDVEGLGVVLIEALLHGKPVIASDTGGIPDIVEDGRTGLLVPSGDHEALAAAIARLRDDPGLAHRLADAGARHVAEKFSWDTIVSELRSVYSEVTGMPEPGGR